jgi:hypothetical protein
MRRQLLGCFAVVFALGCSEGSHDHGSANSEQSEAAGIDLSRSLATAAGHFVVTIGAAEGEIPVNEEYALDIAVKSAAGAPVDGAKLDVVVEMTEHQHGMTTSPELSSLGGGVYRLAPMLFQMSGIWSVTVQVDANGMQDTVGFSIECNTERCPAP